MALLFVRTKIQKDIVRHAIFNMKVSFEKEFFDSHKTNSILLQRVVLSIAVAVPLLFVNNHAHAQSFDVNACARSPVYNVPDVIDLLRPLDTRLLNCIPGLDSLQSSWSRYVARIQRSMGSFAIGNNGNTRIEKLEYSPYSKMINLRVAVNASHRWTTVKECLVPRMETTYSSVKECVEPRIVQKCGRWVRTPWGSRECLAPYPAQEGCNRWFEKSVPTGTRQVGCNKWLNEPVQASTTCSYEYRYYITSQERRPQFGCNLGKLGDYQIDASAVTSILNGEMPSLGSLLTSVSITPPLFIDRKYDSYQDTRSRAAAKYAPDEVYFSSESFVQWASAENQGANIILSVLSGGSYGAEFTRQIYERMKTELLYMSPFFSRIGGRLSADELTSLLTGGSSIARNGIYIKARTLNIPIEYKKCMIRPVNECSPSLRSPRLGFYIIASPRR